MSKFTKFENLLKKLVLSYQNPTRVDLYKKYGNLTESYMAMCENFKPYNVPYLTIFILKSETGHNIS